MKKRALTASVFVILFLLICVSRLGYIAISGNYMASKGYNSYSLTVSKRPYNLYYSDFSKLTNNVRKYTLVLYQMKRAYMSCTVNFH
ncbi:MAG: hypothetical protein IJT65_05520 [Eubacterium sp.]|nr:hypothetical protein [Eubacterium sp.]